MKRIYVFILILLAFLKAENAFAQLTVNTTVNPNQLIQSLIGSGLAVSNITMNCPPGAYGTFSNGNTTNLGINSGIMLTTGTANVGGAASIFNSQCNNTTVNDVDLVAIDPTAIYDVCILEFDIIPKCDTLQVSFVFGSEEYPVFVNSINDLFGFFITGPNPASGTYNGLNIATLPVPGNPAVTINNVNNGNTNTGPCMNCAYYIDNSVGATIVYDGMTTVLTSSIWLVPCATYHFKIAIADASDCIYDSGVFLDFITCATGFQYTTANTPDICNSCSGTATVNVTGGLPPYTYQWLPSGGTNATATGLCAGTYSVLVMDQSSCGIPDTVIITVGNNGSITAAATQQDAACFGDCNASITVTPTGGNAPFTYAWSSGGTGATESGLCAGTYSVTVTDSTGCTGQYTYTITQPPQIALTITGTDSICAGDASTLIANPSGGTGTYTVSWDNSLPNGLSQIVSPASNTVYTATVTDANGCSVQQTYSVTIAPAPTAAFANDPGTCIPSIIQFTDASTGASIWQWDFGDPSVTSDVSNQQNPVYTYNAAGTYIVTLIVSNNAGCTDTLIINSAVTTYPNPTASINVSNNVVSELSPEIIFNDISNGGTNCVLYFGDGDSLVGCNFNSVTHTYPAAGTYTAMQIVTNANGCADTTYITVIVEEETTIYVPNAFTPNNNGNNDQFFAYGTKVENFQMYVFDRWGNLIFQSNDMTKGWDGTYKNNPVQEDVYVWKISYSDTRGKKYKLLGHVSLIR
jgi:gliding motility-associated-like protein